jgi:hypothetical protein
MTVCNSKWLPGDCRKLQFVCVSFPNLVLNTGPVHVCKMPMTTISVKINKGNYFHQPQKEFNYVAGK